MSGVQLKYVMQYMRNVAVQMFCHLLPAVQGSVHGVDGILADIKGHWVQKHIHIKRGVLGAAGGCSLALEHK